MDPLSITASALAILSATTATVKGAKRFHEAPGEMEALLNDLAEVQVNMKCLEEDMQPLVSQGRLEKNYHDDLLAKLACADVLVKQLADCVTLDRGRHSRISSASARLRWARSRGKVKTLKLKLEQLRRDLEMNLGILHR
jgi:DNA polymerase III epsilon subunit-like protein